MMAGLADTNSTACSGSDLFTLNTADPYVFSSMHYDVFEVILSHLDGRSLLSCSCVCKHWNSMCETYISHGGVDFWMKKCEKEFNHSEIQLCLSGSLEENWFAVYKTAHIENALRARTVKSHKLPVVSTLTHYNLSLHIVGRMLVVSQGAMIYIYDIMTRTKLGQCQHLNVFDAIIKKKTYNGTCMATDDTNCDIMLMLCGFEHITNLAVARGHTFLSEGPTVLRIRDTIDQRPSGTNTYFARCGEPEHVTLVLPDPEIRICYIVDTCPHIGLTLNKIDRCPYYEDDSYNRPMIGDREPSLNHKVVIRDMDPDDTTVDLIHCKDGKLYKRIIRERQPIRTEPQYTAKTIHCSDEVIPVIAGIHSSEEDESFNFNDHYYHRICYQKLTNRNHLKRELAKKQVTPEGDGANYVSDADEPPEKMKKLSPSAVSRRSKREVNLTTIMPRLCVVCGTGKRSKRKKRGRSWVHDNLVQTEKLDSGKLLQAATERDDENVLVHIRGVDCVAKEISYHSSCFREYTRPRRG